MEGWLNQVGAMDAVISIANTTVHGAGQLLALPAGSALAVRQSRRGDGCELFLAVRGRTLACTVQRCVAWE